MQLVRAAEHLPELRVTKRLPQPPCIASEFERGGIDQHLIPRLLVLVAGKDDGLAIWLWKEVRVDMKWESRRLLRWKKGVKEALLQRLRVDP